MIFRATREEMKRAGEIVDDDTTELIGGGYLASLGVYHDLHCLVCSRLLFLPRILFHLMNKPGTDRVTAETPLLRVQGLLLRQLNFDDDRRR